MLKSGVQLEIYPRIYICKSKSLGSHIAGAKIFVRSGGVLCGITLCHLSVSFE